uniref:Uncharacterized protein n=1 Tax=Amphimedon queenslandica TaxID=400682 RepID=A0A1X7VSC9_AMPQE
FASPLPSDVPTTQEGFVLLGSPTDSCCPLLASSASRHDWISHDSIYVPISQHCLYSGIHKSSFSSLLGSAPSTRFRALALSSSLPHSGDWLSVVPSSQLGLHLLDQEFRLFCQCWQGINHSSEPLPCWVCPSQTDVFGDHQLGCRWNRNLIRHHDSIRDVLYVAAQSVALAHRKEVPSLIPGSSAPPAAIFLPQLKGFCKNLPSSSSSGTRVTCPSNFATQTSTASQLFVPNLISILPQQAPVYSLPPLEDMCRLKHSSFLMMSERASVMADLVFSSAIKAIVFCADDDTWKHILILPSFPCSI